MISHGASTKLTGRRQRNKRASSTPNIRKQWVPKAVLKAQGYYQGTRTLWIPATQPHELPKKSKPRNTNANPIPYVTLVKPTRYWRPKPLTPSKTTIPPQSTTPLEPKRQMKWVNKSHQPAKVQPRARPSSSYVQRAQNDLFARLTKLKVWRLKRLPVFSSHVDTSHCLVGTTTCPSGDRELGSDPPPQTTELHCHRTIDL